MILNLNEWESESLSVTHVSLKGYSILSTPTWDINYRHMNHMPAPEPKTQTRRTGISKLTNTNKAPIPILLCYIRLVLNI